tara:strand:- start:102 stop:767 length:666 start_codon:yes stop_codon:yes gene_type:complete
MKKYFLLLIILLQTSNCFAHVAHYSNLSNLQFDINRNGNYVGYHQIDFSWSENGDLKVTNVINFKLTKFGINFYRYNSQGIERYNSQGKLVSFESKTNDNGKAKFCKIRLKNSIYKVFGTNYEGIVDVPFRISSYWNHEILTVSKQVSGITCRVLDQKVKFIKRENFKFMNKDFNTSLYDIKGKKLNTQVWFDEKTKMIVHQVLHKRGKWDYKLKNYELIK